MTLVPLSLMASSLDQLPLLTTLAGAFAAAWVCGLITQRLGLSPIVGYLVGGILIGPHTPGFVGDVGIASQLAEVGVILLMFAVGLHFHVKDLLAVRSIAIPGALVQSAVATGLGMAAAMAFGWEAKAGLVCGMAMAVASTVVLMRVLMDNEMMDTPHGHAAVGWLVVEDILTVILLVLIPTMGAGSEEAGWGGFLTTLVLALVKLAVLVVLLLVAGARVIPWILVQVARLRSRELFTLTVLVFAVAVATGAAALFGVSMALGAFLAGMAVGQSPVSQQAAAEALPLRDAFAVVFFVSIGMLFDPTFVLREPLLVLVSLAIVMIGKPLAALLIVGVMGYSLRTAMTAAIGLAQIGEFSFILAALGLEHGLLPKEALSMLIATSIISITVNPLLFRSLSRWERLVESIPYFWSFVNQRALKAAARANESTAEIIKAGVSPLSALIVGYGPAGRTADRLLRSAGMETTVIDMNMDTVTELRRSERLAIFGDASREEVLRQAGVATASYLVVTLPHSQNRGPLVSIARELNPALKILVRARYLREKEELTLAGATDVCVEESETAIALARMTLSHLGAKEPQIEDEVTKIRREMDRQNAMA